MKRLTQDEAIERAVQRGVMLLGKYVSNRHKTTFGCMKCGNKWDATPNNVFNGTGCPVCSRKKMTGRKRRVHKILEDHGDWLLIDISTKMFPEATMKINTEHWNEIKNHGSVCLNSDGYPVQYFKKTIAIHRYLLPPKDGLECDHINRDKTDNRISNLRIVTHTENMRNSSCFKHGKRCKGV